MELKPDKKSVLFAGGKLISIVSSDGEKDDEGIMFTKNADGSWTIQVKAVISKEEAQDTIHKFSDMIKDDANAFEDTYPNMPFFTGMDEQENPVFARLSDNSSITPVYYRDQFGAITLKLNLAGFGKTQNPKTQNPKTQNDTVDKK
ncbi:MAG: hypothetical protein JST86_09875 [Bacteroidetes bacterium]|nr:hypothetical protein [Bacteroidota bacterium]